MPIPGHADYKRREFCKAIRCPVQNELDSKKEGSPEYERTRKACTEACRFTAWQFHRWLTDNGYVVVRPEN